MDEAAEAEKFARYHIELKAATVHHAAQKGDLKQLDKHVTEGIHQGNPESVTLQQRESLLGMMPLHIACEHGQLEAVEVRVRGRAPKQGRLCAQPVHGHAYTELSPVPSASILARSI